mmetsp:Transcript_88448/g.270725  ORF Transcript_88448/g.270725 Transcript_88448/m.270725 type:complete len:286 (-) Transcript_88448:1229-2086(-)
MSNHFVSMPRGCSTRMRRSGLSSASFSNHGRWLSGGSLELGNHIMTAAASPHLAPSSNATRAAKASSTYRFSRSSSTAGSGLKRELSSSCRRPLSVSSSSPHVIKAVSQLLDTHFAGLPSPSSMSDMSDTTSRGVFTPATSPEALGKSNFSTTEYARPRSAASSTARSSPSHVAAYSSTSRRNCPPSNNRPASRKKSLNISPWRTGFCCNHSSIQTSCNWPVHRLPRGNTFVDEPPTRPKQTMSPVFPSVNAICKVASPPTPSKASFGVPTWQSLRRARRSSSSS